jgi:hypothetical protein
MSSIVAKIKSEPAVVIGVVAAALLAAIQTLGGSDLVSGSVVDWATRALDPNTGWALPILIGVVTRFFVSPATK